MRKLRIAPSTQGIGVRFQSADDPKHVRFQSMLHYLKRVNRENGCCNHPNRDVISFCQGCKKQLCEECLVEGPRYYYCKSEVCLTLFRQEVDFAENPRFCAQCLSETLNESSGNIISVNFVGDKLVSESPDECSICGSEVFEKVGPVSRKGAYKVIWLNAERTQFISRRVKET